MDVDIPMLVVLAENLHLQRFFTNDRAGNQRLSMPGTSSGRYKCQHFPAYYLV
jgi:hypothetical protein